MTRLRARCCEGFVIVVICFKKVTQRNIYSSPAKADQRFWLASGGLLNLIINDRLTND